MIDLKTFFKNHFDTNRISDDNLNKFGKDHVQRITANNPDGIYTAMINATTPLVTAFGSAIIAEGIKGGVQKGSTFDVDKIIDKFLVAVRRREGAVRSAFGVDSSKYLEFFPQGLTEYNEATKANIDALMARMKDRTNQYKDDLGSAIVAEFADLYEEYETDRTKQLLTFGQVEGLRTATASARAALVRQLGENLLFIAWKNLGHPDRLDDFMDQSIIRRPSDREDGTLSGIVQGGAILSIESQGIDADTQFTLRNTGVTELLFALSTAADTMPEGAGLTVAPGEMRQVPASALGPSGNAFLNVQNQSADVAGGWEVVVL